MPDKETVDTAALDYGVLVAGIQKVRQEKADLETEIKALAEQRGMLNDENAKTQEANMRVRAELIEAEKQLAAVKQMKLEEIDQEKRMIEDQRQKLAKATQDMSQVEEALKRRTIEVEARERALREAQQQNEGAARATETEAARVEELERNVHARETALVVNERKVSDREAEVEKKLRTAQEAEKNMEVQLHSNRLEMQKAQEDRRVAQIKLLELAGVEQRIAASRAEVKLFDDVAKEAITFIQQNVKNYDQIDAYFRERFPSLVNRLANV